MAYEAHQFRSAAQRFAFAELCITTSANTAKHAENEKRFAFAKTRGVAYRHVLSWRAKATWPCLDMTSGSSCLMAASHAQKCIAFPLHIHQLTRLHMGRMNHSSFGQQLSVSPSQIYEPQHLRPAQQMTRKMKNVLFSRKGAELRTVTSCRGA